VWLCLRFGVALARAHARSLPLGLYVRRHKAAGQCTKEENCTISIILKSQAVRRTRKTSCGSTAATNASSRRSATSNVCVGRFRNMELPLSSAGTNALITLSQRNRGFVRINGYLIHCISTSPSLLFVRASTMNLPLRYLSIALDSGTLEVILLENLVMSHKVTSTGTPVTVTLLKPLVAKGAKT
jgi:hypothetical protein